MSPRLERPSVDELNGAIGDLADWLASLKQRLNRSRTMRGLVCELVAVGDGARLSLTPRGEALVVTLKRAASGETTLVAVADALSELEAAARAKDELALRWSSEVAAKPGWKAGRRKAAP